MRQTNWTPVLRGEIYCSSACAYNCKHVDYVRAVRAFELTVRTWRKAIKTTKSGRIAGSSIAMIASELPA